MRVNEQVRQPAGIVAAAIGLQTIFFELKVFTIWLENSTDSLRISSGRRNWFMVRPVRDINHLARGSCGGCGQLRYDGHGGIYSLEGSRSARSQLIQDKMIDCLTDAPDGSIREADSERPAAGILLQLKRIHWRAVAVSAGVRFARADGRAAHYARARVLFERLAAHLAADLDGTGGAEKATFRQHSQT